MNLKYAGKKMKIQSLLGRSNISIAALQDHKEMRQFSQDAAS